MWKRFVAKASCLLALSLGFGGVTWLGAPSRAQAAAVCSVTLGSGAFGATLSPLTGGTVDTTANLNFSCSGMTPGLPVSLCPSLDAGSAGGDGAGGRYLKAADGAVVRFQIYQDSARTQTWGSASLLLFGAVPTITATPGANGSVNVNQTLYARIWTPVATTPGAYSTTFAGQNFFWGLNLLTCAGVTIGYASPPPSFTFSATLVPDCQITSSPVDFGTSGALTANKDGQGALGVTCTAGTPYSIGLDNGLAGTGPTQRKMKKGSETVTYGLYKNTGRDQPWGLVGQGAAYVVGGSGTGSAQPLAVYGRVPAQTTPSTGAYADTIVATVTY